MNSRIHTYLQERIYFVTAGIILMTIITLALTLLPAQDMLPDKIWNYDKLGHLLIFGAWTFLIGYYRLLTKPESVNLFTIFFLGVCFGAAIEGLQYIMPFNRSADFFDFAFDTLGCFIAVLGLYFISEHSTILLPDER